MDTVARKRHLRGDRSNGTLRLQEPKEKAWQPVLDCQASLWRRRESNPRPKAVCSLTLRA